MSRKPKPSHFNAPTAPANELHEKIKNIQEELDPFANKKYFFYCFIISLFCLNLLALIIDGPQLFLDAILREPIQYAFFIPFVSAAVAWPFWFFLCSLIKAKGQHDENSKLLILELATLEKNYENRIAYENALANWEYFNLVSSRGYWISKKGTQLEKDFGNLLISKGWKVSLTKASGDGGIDLICEEGDRTVYVQCKGHAKPLGVAAIRDAAGVKMAHAPSDMVVFCPQGFTKGSIDFAAQTGVGLIDVESVIGIAKDLQRFGDI